MIKINRVENIPILRIILSIIAFVLFIQQKIIIALIIFLIAAISDIVDGYVARKTNQVRKLGIMLDPIADKIMIALILSICVMYFKFPIVFIPFVIFRDIITFTLSVILYAKTKEAKEPTILGKATTFMQVMLIIFFIINFPIKIGWLMLTIGISFIAGIEYMLIGLKKWRELT